jgi:DNA-binding transcriptional LysR family regulator
LLAQESSRLLSDVARVSQRVKQIAGGWEDRLAIVTDEILEFETLAPVIRDFDELQSGVELRITHEVLGGTWEALRDGRADLVIGATNEPPAIPKLRWRELGVMEWVFAVARRHPLAKAKEPLEREVITEYRSVVVADSSRRTDARSYGVLDGQATLAVPSMQAKIQAQSEGLGVGWLPRDRVRALLARGDLVERQMADPREPNTLYIAWRGDREGRALTWWVTQLQQTRLANRLVRGVEVPAGSP